MKALIYDIKRFAVHDGPGIRTTIFFKGCPLECWWCHNPESRRAEIEHTQKINKLDGKKFTTQIQTGKPWKVEDLMKEIRKEKPFMFESGGGVTLSGGEPLFYPEYLEQVLDALRTENIHTAIDTSGYASEEIFTRLALKADLFLYDIKHMNNDLHKKYTGVGNITILKNLEFLHKSRIPVIIRFPLIPGINDGSNVIEMRNYLLDYCPEFKEIHILPYHNIASHKYRQFGIENKMPGQTEPSQRQINDVKNTFMESGFLVKIGG
ncbi:MAG: glycyl-radical enzyme activating protein [Bacteroidales bacterium]|nr:glycyl-radical enzyme activating protein [Bacteroidales bacterium]MCF8389830.1 glycyl-radical enzyme activating protein [Bacteroidales bacterium]